MEEYLQYMKTLRSQMNGTVPPPLSLSLSILHISNYSEDL